MPWRRGGTRWRFSARPGEPAYPPAQGPAYGGETLSSVHPLAQGRGGTRRPPGHDRARLFIPWCRVGASRSSRRWCTPSVRPWRRGCTVLTTRRRSPSTVHPPVAGAARRADRQVRAGRPYIPCRRGGSRWEPWTACGSFVHPLMQGRSSKYSRYPRSTSVHPLAQGRHDAHQTVAQGKTRSSPGSGVGSRSGGSREPRERLIPWRRGAIERGSEVWRALRDSSPGPGIAYLGRVSKVDLEL